MLSSIFVRLLICEHCSSVEEMPDYDGPWQNDTWFNELVKKHLLPSGEKTHGDVHIGRIESDKWTGHKEDVVKQISSEFVKFSDPGTGTGLGETFYDVKSNYSEDAMKCWRVDHQRTTNCGDYMSAKMEVKPDTKAERKSERLSVKDRPAIHVCSFCPYNSIVMQRKRKAQGDYAYTT
jgi:hypothetical protein